MDKKVILLLIVFLLFNPALTFLNAQVTIGSDKQAEKGAFLEIKDREITAPDGDDVTTLENSEKGLLFPKVSLKEAKKLTPLYGGTESGGVWSDNSTALEKLRATGMIVYNINPDAVKLDEGLYMWRVDEWIKVAGATGKAVFRPVECSHIKAVGNYVEGTPTTTEHYLSISAYVEKAGTYEIAATTGNGYSFYVTGVVVERDVWITIRVPAMGTPINPGVDNLTIEGIELVTGCQPTVTVASALAEYSLNCSRTRVLGLYLKGEALTMQTIEIWVNVTKTGSYIISTPITYGITFYKEGEFTSLGMQKVELLGSGMPTVNEDFEVQIKANTLSGNDICYAKIPITLPPMTYAIIGGGDYSWNTTNRLNALTNGSKSFGPGESAVVRIKQFAMLWSTSDVNTAASRLNSGYNGKQPDIVLYFAYGANPNTAVTNALITYINKGGCVIYGACDNTASYVNTLLGGIFGISTAQNQIAGSRTTDDNCYQINNIPDDPVINGPFGNLCNKYWGEDNASNANIIVTALPPNSVQVASAYNKFGKYTVNPAYSMIWYNDNKNFFYFGDSVATHNPGNTYDQNGFPSYFTTDGLPLDKFYGNWPHDKDEILSQNVYNSALELNAVAWAIRKAAVSGINPH